MKILKNWNRFVQLNRYSACSNYQLCGLHANALLSHRDNRKLSIKESIKQLSLPHSITYNVGLCAYNHNFISLDKGELKRTKTQGTRGTAFSKQPLVQSTVSSRR